MAALIVNKTALLANAINAKLDYLIRNNLSLDDVIVTPIAGTWPGTRNLPWYGYGYMNTLPLERSAQFWVSEFGHFRVLLGSQDQLRFPEIPGLSVHHCEGFEDPMDAAEQILLWLDEGRVGNYPKKVF